MLLGLAWLSFSLDFSADGSEAKKSESFSRPSRSTRMARVTELQSFRLPELLIYETSSKDLQRLEPKPTTLWGHDVPREAAFIKIFQGFVSAQLWVTSIGVGLLSSGLRIGVPYVICFRIAAAAPVEGSVERNFSARRLKKSWRVKHIWNAFENGSQKPFLNARVDLLGQTWHVDFKFVSLKLPSLAQVVNVCCLGQSCILAEQWQTVYQSAT